MNKLPLRKCNHVGCNKMTRQGRCDEHKARESKNRPGDPFYSSRDWITIRDMRRQLSPCCELCLKEGRTKPTFAIDHIKPRATHPELELDIDNTQGLCESCHNRKTAKEMAQGVAK